MTTEIPGLQNVIERLERVERQNRRLRRAGAVSIVVAGALILMAQSAPPRRVVEAQQFLLKDKNGATRALWSVEGGRAHLSFTDPSGRPGQGRPGVVLGMSEEGHPELIIRGPLGAQLALGVSDDGPAALFSRRLGPPQLTLQVFDDGPSALFSDARGNAQMSAGSLGVGITGVSMNDSAGKLRIILAVKGENPGLAAFDSGGNQRLALGVAADTPSVLLQESYGKTRLGLYGFQDRPALVAFDANGTAFYRVP